MAHTDSSGTYQYLYGNLKKPFQLTAMRDPAGVLTYYYYDDEGLLFAFDKGGIRYYVATDQVGTPKTINDATGSVVKYLEYDSFGMPTLANNPDFIMPVGFAGGVTDTTTGLVRFGYRDYEPNNGRWTAKDPIFFKGGQGNLYQYVLNNPVNYTDPLGLWTLFGGAGVRGILPGVGGEVGVVGTHDFSTDNESVSGYLEGFAAGGLSLGRGPFVGAWTGKASEMDCAEEIGIDTPLGSISFLFDSNLNFGLTLGTPSLFAGAFAKVKDMHYKKTLPIYNNGL